MMLTGGAAGALSSLMKTTMITSFLATHPVIAATVLALGPIILVAAAIGLAILALKFAWENNLGDIQGKTQAVFAVIGEVFENIGGVLAVAAAAFGEFAAAVGGALNETLAVVGDAMGAIGEAIGNGIEAALDFARGAIGGFIRIGEDMVRGIGDGIGRMWGWVMGRVRELINLIPQAVRDLLGISSPSRVFAEIGGEIAEGLVDGIEAGIPAAEAAGEAISKGVAAGITRATPEALAAMNAQIAALDAAQTGFLDRSGKRHATLKSLWGSDKDYSRPGDNPGASSQRWLDDQKTQIWAQRREVMEPQYYADMFAAWSSSAGQNLTSMDAMYANAASEALRGSVAPLGYAALPSVANQWGLNYADPSGALVGPTTQSGTAQPWFTPGQPYSSTPPTTIQTVINLNGEHIADAVGTYYTQDSRLAGGTL